MARRRFLLDTETPYHISSRCINRDWFGLSMEETWQLMTDYLYFINKTYGIRIHSFVLMNNHFHLLASAPEGNLSKAMGIFLKETSKHLTEASGRINQTWGGRYFRSRLGSYHYFLHAYKYVYRNPVEAGLSQTVEQYPYSTLNGLLGQRRLSIPMIEDTLLFDDLEATLRWLNTAPETSDKEIIRTALRKKDFKIGRNPKNKRAHPLEDRLY